MSTLEEALLKSGAMTEAQLEIVRQEQRVHGGSLDTNILALGYLTEHALQRILETLWGREGQTDFTQEPTAEAAALLGADEADRAGAVPQMLVGNQLHVMVARPESVEQLQTLKHLADYELVPVAVNEVRLKYLLERHFGIAREPRFIEIMDRLLSQAVAGGDRLDPAQDPLIGDPMAGLDPEWMAGAVVAEQDGAAEGVDEDLVEEVIPILEDELLMEVTDEDEAAHDAEQEGTRSLEDDLKPLGPEEFQSALEAVEGMDSLPDVFFRFGVNHFRSVALFKVQGGMVMGWRGAGLGIVSEMIRGIVVPAQSDTFLGRAVETGLYSGRAGNNAVEERIGEQLGCEGDEPWVVAGAVKVGDRPVLVALCVTEDEEPQEDLVAQLRQLTEMASQAVVRLIMSRKKKAEAKAKKPPAKGKIRKKKKPAPRKKKSPKKS